MLKQIPDLSGTDSFKSASSLLCIIELQTYKNMTAEQRLNTLEGVIKAHHRTLEEIGAYNQHIYARYKAAMKKVEQLKKRGRPKMPVGRPRKNP